MSVAQTGGLRAVSYLCLTTVVVSMDVAVQGVGTK